MKRAVVEARRLILGLRRSLPATIPIVAIIAFVFVASEALYRVYLYFDLRAQVAEKTKLPPLDIIGAYGIAPWIFDPVMGFNYNQKDWLTAIIKENAFDRCTISGKANRFGNFGADDDQYETADIKVVIVGSSYTLMKDEKDRLVNEVLSQQLSEHLHRRVDVLNFSRDATGPLSYTDAARQAVSTLRPDVILMLINTPGLIYQRLWRKVMPDETGNERFYQMLSPDAKPQDDKLAFPQVVVINSAITPEWCTRMEAAKTGGDLAALRSNPLVRTIVAENLRQRQIYATPKIAVNFWRLDVSFAYNLLKRRNPFYRVLPFDTPRYAPYERDRYSDDPQFVAAAAELRGSGVPVIPIHLSAYKEYVQGGFEFGEYGVPPVQGKSLVADLERQLGQRWVELSQFYSPSLKANPAMLVHSEANSHPSPAGVRAMADALERVLREDARTARLFVPVSDNALRDAPEADLKHDGLAPPLSQSRAVQE